MKTINNLMLKDIADKLLFAIKDEQYPILINELTIIEKEMSLLDDIPEIKDITPMTFPFDLGNGFLREDVPSIHLNRDELLKNANKVEEGYIVIPKVI